jgi:tetratricopeptide (TPR) repeat protein
MTAWMQNHPAERGGRTTEQIWIAYGERYEALFEQLRRSGQENAMTAATEMGRRGLTYFVRAKAFDKLGDFASVLVTGTHDPTALAAVIAELQAVADQVPAGRDRWVLRLNLANALLQSGRPDRGLPLYAQAAAEAEAEEDWANVGVIYHCLATALGNVGQLDQAKTTYRRSVDAYRKANAPKVQIVGNELEALRIDVMQGHAADALPEIETRLNAVRDWQRRTHAGETVPDAPEPVFLGRVLVGGLDIARQANQRLERWDACLALLTEIEQTERDAGASRHEQYRTRFNQYGPLMKLGRLTDAQRVVEECLAVYREANDLTLQARALSALANIWKERGDLEQAIALARQALSIRNRLPDPSDRAISHGNLANYLEKAGKLEDEARHLLASIIYRLLTQRHDLLSIDLRNLGIRIRRAAQTGGRYDLPRLAEMLALPAFDALKQFLAQRGVDVPELQAAIDQLVEQVRQKAA